MVSLHSCAALLRVSPMPSRRKNTSAMVPTPQMNPDVKRLEDWEGEAGFVERVFNQHFDAGDRAPKHPLSLVEDTARVECRAKVWNT